LASHVNFVYFDNIPEKTKIYPMKTQAILLLLLSVLLLSCSIEEKTAFNGDFSGKTTTKIDMSALITMMSSMDTSGSGKTKFYRDINKGMEEAMNKGTNSTDVKMDFDTIANSLNLTYTFKNLEEANSLSDKLRESQQSMGSAKSAAVAYRWEKKGKILVMPGFENLEQLKSSGQEAMLKTITYSLERSFPKKIDKVSDSRLLISKDRKTLSFKGTAEDLISKPMNEVTVTFK
jgi:ABC-type oligopeptide transport system substrate-binding subunit